MRAGTATKLVLNMLSTGAMIRIGMVFGNLMVNVQPTNQKLQDRADADHLCRNWRSINQQAAALLVNRSEPCEWRS